MIFNPFKREWESVNLMSNTLPSVSEFVAGGESKITREPIEFKNGQPASAATSTARAPRLGRPTATPVKRVAPQKKDSPTSSTASKKTAASKTTKKA